MNVVGGTNIFIKGGHTFYVRGGGGYDDVDKELDVRKANIGP